MFDLMKNTTTKVLLIWCSICQPQKSYTAHNSFGFTPLQMNTNTNTNRKTNTSDTESILATHRFMWILTQCQSESIWAALNLERNVPLQCKLHYIHWTILCWCFPRLLFCTTPDSGGCIIWLSQVQLEDDDNYIDGKRMIILVLKLDSYEDGDRKRIMMMIEIGCHCFCIPESFLLSHFAEVTPVTLPLHDFSLLLEKYKFKIQIYRRPKLGNTQQKKPYE